MEKEMNKPKRFYTHVKKLYFTYKMEYQENGDYHGWDEYALVIGFDNQWFRRDDWYYDGHTFKSYTVFGLLFGKMYTYSWEKK
jgi:hypothetical protein